MVQCVTDQTVFEGGDAQPYPLPLQPVRGGQEPLRRDDPGRHARTEDAPMQFDIAKKPA